MNVIQTVPLHLWCSVRPDDRTILCAILSDQTKRIPDSLITMTDVLMFVDGKMVFGVDIMFDINELSLSVVKESLISIGKQILRATQTKEISIYNGTQKITITKDHINTLMEVFAANGILDGEDDTNLKEL